MSQYLPKGTGIRSRSLANSSMLHQQQYRADIDGLRAIAVLSVLLYHLNPSLLPGGFVGVDVFFAISGYLITSQIYQETRSGTFKLATFYQRRINRIVPALLAVIVVTLLAGALLLSPSDLVRLAKAAISGLLGVSNLYFWREYGNYFSVNTAEVPLLHTWSLGVEEQFYVAWPLLLLLVLRMSRRHTHAIGMVVLLWFMALAVSQLATGIVASASYYLLPTRFFELLLGCLMALLAAHTAPPSRNGSAACYLAGFGLLSCSLAFLDKSSVFPGINALWPCLGTVLLIWAGRRREPFFARLLDNRLMVFIGLISYSLYLWHWPILAYLHYLHIGIDLATGALAAVSAILVAWLSWKFVEVPLRRNGVLPSFRRIAFTRFVLPTLTVAVVGMATVRAHGFPQRFDVRVAGLEQALDANPEVLRSRCHVPTARYATPPDEQKCRLGAEKPGLDGILVGDSFANHYTGMIDVMAKAQGLSLMDYTMAGCPPILEYDNGAADAYAERCRMRNRAVFEHISNGSYSLVILAARWPYTQDAARKLETSVRDILHTGARLILIQRNETIERAAACPVRKLMYRIEDDCSRPRAELPAYLDEIQRRHPDAIRIIDPNRLICRDGRCSSMIEDVLLYREDDEHLNDTGSRLLGRLLLAEGVSL